MSVDPRWKPACQESSNFPTTGNALCKVVSFSLIPQYDGARVPPHLVTSPPDGFGLCFVQLLVCAMCSCSSVLRILVCLCHECFFRRVQSAQARVGSLRSLRPLRNCCSRFVAAAGPLGPQMKASAWCALLTEKQHRHTHIVR